MSEKNPNFEAAFQRLEEILEKMNRNQTSLDEALKLYEEADALINLCSKKLVMAEKKIEMLIKKRDGELELGEEGQPQSEPFDSGVGIS